MKKTILLVVSFLLTHQTFSQFSWSEITSGVTTELTSISAARSGASVYFVWICGYGGVVLKSTNAGDNFTNVSGNGIPNTTQLINIFGIDENTAITSGYVGANTFVYRTSNGGASWTQIFTETNGFINAVWMKTNLLGFMQGDPVGTRWSLWKTTNGGVSWDSSGLYLPKIGSDAGWNNSLWIDQTGDRIWFGTNNTRIYYSSNYGVNWIVQQTASMVNSYSICFPTFNVGNIGFTGGAILLNSTNYGTNWNPITSTGTGNFNGIWGYTNSIVWAVRTNSSIYSSLQTNWGVTHTAPAGTYRHLSGIRNHGGFGYVFGVRNNGGISRVFFLTGGITLISNEIPSLFSLSQNYPNPFNPSTVIKFQVASSSSVKLVVFDVLGREITTLVNEQLNAGTYEVDFDGSKLSSGVYYYKLITGDYAETRKMVLVK